MNKTLITITSICILAAVIAFYTAANAFEFWLTYLAIAIPLEVIVLLLSIRHDQRMERTKLLNNENNAKTIAYSDIADEGTNYLVYEKIIKESWDY